MTKESRKVEAAHSVAAIRCSNPDCQSIHICLFDPSGEIFAEAIVSPEFAATLAVTALALLHGTPPDDSPPGGVTH